MFLKAFGTVATLTRSLSFAVLYLCLVGSLAHPPAQATLTSNVAEPVSVPAARRVHHYVFFGMDRESIPNAKAFFETPAFEGAQVAYSWRQLEQGKDNYEFSLIREDLAFMSARGKKLWIQIQDVAFSDRWKMVPEYLLKDPAYNGGVVRQYKYPGDDESKAVPQGWVARRWDPAVQERYQRLLKALGKEFDGRVTGINTEETSVDFGVSGKLHPKGFTPELYRDAIIANIKVLKHAFPKSIAMVYANFMPGGRPHLEAVYKAARESKVGVGGPDLLPFRPFQRANSYPLILESKGKVPTGLAVQDGNYSDVDKKTGKRATVVELLKFGSDELNLDYIFWCTEEPYFSQELIPFMQSVKRD
jgi:hypothetical protein